MKRRRNKIDLPSLFEGYDWTETRNEEPVTRLVVALDILGRIVHVFPSVDAAGENGYNKYMVKKCCEGGQQTHHHLYWQYQDDFLKKIC